MSVPTSLVDLGAKALAGCLPEGTEPRIEERYRRTLALSVLEAASPLLMEGAQRAIRNERVRVARQILALATTRSTSLRSTAAVPAVTLAELTTIIHEVAESHG